jgi:hypothetical protein
MIEGRIIYRSWSDITGLDEGEVTFSSLDEMFELCLRVQDPDLVDRIILRGVNERGEVRTLTFSFQSLKFGDEA